jgi:hypothetical protein
MDTSPELMIYIQNMIGAQMLYRGGIMSHDILTNNRFSDDTSTNGPEDYQESHDWLGRVSE